MNLETIYNENYGTTVATNGNYLIIGNPPSKTYDPCEGFSRIGQVFLYRKDSFRSNYNLKKIYTKQIFDNNGTLIPYFTEQSSSLSFTSSLIRDNGNLNEILSSCDFLVLEQGNRHIYQSNYGSAIGLSTYFLAIGDSGVSSSFYFGNTSSYASVDIFEVNPNYTFDSSKGVIPLSTQSQTNLQTYNLSNNPLCVITGSISEGFGKSISLTNNYLAIGAPDYNDGQGRVHIYKYNNSTCFYKKQTVLTASVSKYPTQKGFGFSLSLDKKNENILAVGSNQISQSNVYLYQSSSNGWTLNQVFSQNTSSKYYALENSTFELVPSGSQINTRYGYSVSLCDTVLAVGSPNDLVYWEYSGSNTLRQRGSVYIYTNNQCPADVNCGFQLLTKLYGDDVTFKDNLFGFSVSVYNNKILVGSPKPYFPFSSNFISSSIDYYDKYTDQNDFGESTYCGQSLLYSISGSLIRQMTTDPISKRKEVGKPFNAFGYSVDVSDENLIVGAPIPLNDDFHLSGLIITESGSIADNYELTSSTQIEICNPPSKFVYFQMEECITCDGIPASGALSGGLSGACSNLVVFADEQGDSFEAIDKIYGKTYTYNLEDLQQNYNVGNIFYNNNKLIINNSGSILSNLTLDPTNHNNSYLYMNYQSQLALFEKQYICTVEPGEFNVSTNPTSITSSVFDYGVVNTETFDFNNLDIILRYINSRLTYDASEKWWENFVSGDIDTSIFNYYSSSYINYTQNRLTPDLNNKCGNLNFDINDDGAVTYQDGTAIWKYFIQELTINNYQDYINPRSRRKTYDGIIKFLNIKTGKFAGNLIKPAFFQYNYSSSIDPTGSYLAPYITTVGLYDGSDLVAIAKLAQPIKNTGEIPINIVVKWDT